MGNQSSNEKPYIQYYFKIIRSTCIPKFTQIKVRNTQDNVEFKINVPLWHTVDAKSITLIETEFDSEKQWFLSGRMFDENNISTYFQIPVEHETKSVWIE